MPLDAYREAVRADVAPRRAQDTHRGRRHDPAVGPAPRPRDQAHPAARPADEPADRDRRGRRSATSSTRRAARTPSARAPPSTRPGLGRGQGEGRRRRTSSCSRTRPSSRDIAKADSDDTGSAADGGDMRRTTTQADLDPAFGDGDLRGRPQAGPDPAAGQVGRSAGTSSSSIDRRPAADRPDERPSRRRPRPAGRRLRGPRQGQLRGPDAAKGGDMGWIAHDQLVDRRWRTRSSRPRSAASSRRSPDDATGCYLFKVSRGADAAARRRPDRDPQGQRVQQLVRRPRRPKATIDVDPDVTPYLPRPGSLSRAMLDALARRGAAPLGPRPSAGLQVVAAERLIGDAARADPAAAHRARWRSPRHGAAADGAPRPPADRRPLPGRHGPARPRSAGRPRGGSTRPTTRSAGSARRTATTIGALTDGRPRARRSTSRRSRRSCAGRRRGRCPGSADRLRAPDGCPWDREQTHESLREPPPRGGLRGLRRARRTAPTPALAGELGDLLLQVVLHAQLAAEAGVFDLADVQAAIGPQDRPAPPPRLRRRRGADRGRRQPPVGADQGRRAGRRRGRPRRRRPGDRPRRRAEERPRRDQPIDAGPRRQPGDAGAGGRTSATTGRRSTGVLAKVHEELGELLAAATDAERARGARRPADGRRQPRPAARHRGRGRPARRQRQVPAPLPERRAAGRRAGRRAARPRLRGARRALGRGQGRWPASAAGRRTRGDAR